MISKRTVTLLIILLAVVKVNAQLDSANFRSAYEKEVIYFSGGKYVKNSIKYPIKNLKNEFQPNSEAFHLYQMYRADSRKAGYYLLSATLLYTAGLISYKSNNALGAGLIIASVIPIGFTWSFGVKADKKMRRSVWLRNRDVLLQKY